MDRPGTSKIARPRAEVFHARALGLRAWAVDELSGMAEAHTHPDLELNWLGEGAINYLAGGRRWRLVAGQMGLFWGGIPHQLMVDSDGGRAGRGVWLTLPLAWLMQGGLGKETIGRLMAGEPVVLPLREEVARQWLAEIGTVEIGAGPGPTPALLEIEALLRRWASRAPEDRTTKGAAFAAENSPVPERIAAWLAAHYRDECSMADLGAALRLHPKYAMTVFKRRTGRSVRRYVLDLRLAHAQRLLAAGNRSVLEIAMASGFGSLAAFYAAFRRDLGERPLAYRRRMRQS